MHTSTDRLYQLLPALYKGKDKTGDLQILMSVLENELVKLETQAQQIYKDYFIDTCQTEAIADIGKLLGVDNIEDIHYNPEGQRALVANAVVYRQYKGSLWSIEQILKHITGWPLKLVCFKEHIAQTQHYQFFQKDKGRTASVRDLPNKPDTKSAFNTFAYTVDFHSHERGRYNLNNIGIFIWPIPVFQLKKVPAKEIIINEKQQQIYSFDSLGVVTPLFHYPQNYSSNKEQATLQHLPILLDYQQFAQDLKNKQSIFYGESASLAIYKITDRNEIIYVPQSEIISQDIKLLNEVPDNKIGIDVKAGQFVVGKLHQAKGFLTNYSYSFSSTIGRLVGLDSQTYQNSLQADQYIVPVKTGAELIDQLSKLKDLAKQTDKTILTIQIVNNIRLNTDLTIELTGLNKKLIITADAEIYPVIDSNVKVNGSGKQQIQNFLALKGLGIRGTLTLDATYTELTIDHCTLIPQLNPSLIQSSATSLVKISDSLLGNLKATDNSNTTMLEINQSIIDGRKEKNAIAIAGSKMQITAQNITCIGKIESADFGSKDSLLLEYHPILGFKTMPFQSVQYGQPNYLRFRSDQIDKYLAADQEQLGAFSNTFYKLRQYNLNQALKSHWPIQLYAKIYYEEPNLDIETYETRSFDEPRAIFNKTIFV